MTHKARNFIILNLSLFVLCLYILPGLDAVQARTLRFPWLKNPEWRGQAEIAIYTGRVMRYQQNRKVKLVLVTVTEPFRLDQLVKSESSRRQGVITVLKQNQILNFQTGVYPYRQMNSVFWRVDSGSLLKMNMSSQEWCGQTFKEARLYPNYLQLSYNSYWENEAVGYYRILLPKPSSPHTLRFLYDELPLIVRSSDLVRYSYYYIFPLLMSSQVNRPDFDIGESARRPRYSQAKVTFSIGTLYLGQRKFNSIQKIQIHFSDPDRNRRDIFYVHQLGKNRVLLGWDRHDGGKFRLKELYYSPYWKQNGLGDRLQNNQLRTLEL